MLSGRHQKDGNVRYLIMLKRVQKNVKSWLRKKNVHVKYIVEDLQSIELEVTDLIACSWFHTPPEVSENTHA